MTYVQSAPLSHSVAKHSDLAIDYSLKALQRDVERVRCAWDEVRERRDRFAIYDYLTAVFDLVNWWAAEGQAQRRARHTLRLSGNYGMDAIEPFAAVILCTSDVQRVDGKTRSKWSRALRYAAAVKSDREALRKFMQRKGGINSCADHFTKRGSRRIPQLKRR